jgi:outer membrane protein OmpA-like peptidoglycan-associated protein
VGTIQEATMKWGARGIPTMAIAFFLVPALFADDTTKPAGAPAKRESPKSGVAAGDSTESTLPGKPLTAAAANSPHPPAGRSMGHSRAHTARSTGARHATPKVELFLGYSYWRAVPKSTGNRIEALHGGSTSLAYNLNSHVGLVFDFGGFRADSLRLNSPGAGFAPSSVADADGNAFSYLAGPRISFRNHDRLTPFFQVLGGAVHASDVKLDGCPATLFSCKPLLVETVFAMTAGGGLDLRLNHRVAWRVIQAEYLLTRFQDPSSLGSDPGWQSNVRLSTGIVFRFGGNPPPPPNLPPVVSCSLDSSMVYAESGDVAAAHAVASDPDNDPLTYSWTTTGGTVEGTGSEARWNSAATTPGTYAVKVRVEDGRGGSADCSTDIRVEPRPNRPPTMSCSADRNSVFIGEPVQIVATASDADGDPLTYSWESTGGTIHGTGASATFDSAAVQAGHYSVTGHVNDGRGGTADCQLGIDVREPPPPPEMVELESRLALHSIYFPTARPSAAYPDGGLVGSQEKILTTLAEDFKRYLTFKAEAHLILGGHADQRGSPDYNKALTDRRVARTKSFLVSHGVSPAAIDTRSFGEEDDLNAEQVKTQIAQNPELTREDRQQMLRNLSVMVLANNRRVDVTLSTTGQESVRRYPFNAKDFLALINTKAGESKSRTKAAPKKKSN